jgi:hypothetical protein
MFTKTKFPTFYFLIVRAARKKSRLVSNANRTALLLEPNRGTIIDKITDEKKCHIYKIIFSFNKTLLKEKLRKRARAKF